MPKPTTEELILKELRAIRSLLEGFASETKPIVTKPPGEAKPKLTSKIMGL